MLNKDLTQFMQSLSWVHRNWANERKALLQGLLLLEGSTLSSYNGNYIYITFQALQKRYVNLTSFSKPVLAGWEAAGGCAKEFSKSPDDADAVVGVSRDSKSTSAAGLACSGALTAGGCELGRGWAIVWGVELTEVGACR